MPKNIKNNTLKEILDIILYEAPSTQDEIAEKLNISRRYVTKLLKPLIDENVIKKAYVVDLKKFNEISECMKLIIPFLSILESTSLRKCLKRWVNRLVNSLPGLLKL